MIDDAVDARTLARLFGVAEQTVRDLAGRDIVVRVGRGRFAKDASTTAYIAHLREVASGRGGADAVETLTAERARLAHAQADAVETKNAVLSGELVRADDVERTWTEHIRKARSAILAVPSRIRHLLGHIGEMETRVIDRELRDALAALGAAPDADDAGRT